MSAFCRRVSATDLSTLTEPKLHEHHELPPDDKLIWDKSCMEEHLGLHSETDTWDYISEDDYQRIKKIVGRPLPTMAISKIKTDKHGKPERAKYRIVVLGNLDPHTWTNTDCFAPVLSVLELRILVPVATQLKTIPKSGDVAQAFVQSVLPENEKCVCRPPKGCPITPPNTYLLLKCTLYGLKRSPRHWCNTCRKALIALGLKPLPNAPCIFAGKILENEPPLYLGLCVDDFIFFSSSSKVEEAFQTKFCQLYKAEFQPKITHFLGVNFETTQHDDGHVTIFMHQPNDAQKAIDKCGLTDPATKSASTPYRSSYPVDSIPDEELSALQASQNNTFLQEINGQFNWLSTQTRPDIATITNILAQCNHKCSSGHINATKYLARCLKGTLNHGLTFLSRDSPLINSFVKFPIPSDQITPLTDANWGPQDASIPNPDDPPTELDLFKSRSIGGCLIWLGGSLHWSSKRQTFTARSSTDAEIEAVDDFTKDLQCITNILRDLQLLDKFTNSPIQIHNDNNATVLWSHNMTAKGLRCIQMRENAVRELVQQNFIDVVHIDGKNNPFDIFTKEDKDSQHFVAMRDILVQPPPSACTHNSNSVTSITAVDIKCSSALTIRISDAKTSPTRPCGAKGGVERLCVNPSSWTTGPEAVVTS